jgi:hypothetical protein
LALVLLLLIGMVAGGMFLLGRPRLRFSNTLAAPVRLTLGEESKAVAPGATVTLPLARGRTSVLQWEMQRPLSANDQPMGEPIVGSVVLREPKGSVPARATSRESGTDYFAPLITNGSSQNLRVMVNAGLEGGVDCRCAVRPGARRVFIGYYRLYRNSTVEAQAASGASATFRDLGPQVRTVDGSVGLRFDDKDLRMR